MKRAKPQILKNKIRRDQLMPAGVPRYIKIFDNNTKGKGTFDRYTCVFIKKSIISKEDRSHYGTRFMFIGMSCNPFHPQGFGQHGEIEPQNIGSHLGKRIKFEDLPEDCRKLVIQDYKDLWNL